MDSLQVKLGIVLSQNQEHQIEYKRQALRTTFFLQDKQERCLEGRVG